MAKDYFQDITPPTSSGPSRPGKAGQSVGSADVSQSSPPMTSISSAGNETPERSIRNIQVSPTRTRPRVGAEDIRDAGMADPPVRQGARYWMWGAVALALLVLGAIGLVAFRPTTVTVTPRSHTILFDETVRFSAYPKGTAATGTLPFTVHESTFEDSEVVPAKGVEHVEERASGTITVYNEYSTQSMKLLKNTRFQTPSGLIFKTPAEVVIPGKKSTAPGEISITVFADKTGEQYNVGPVEKFTLPGLASKPEYKKVYARSTSPMAGGFAGERPAAAPGALDAAKAAIRSRLQEKIQREAHAQANESTFVFADLVHVTFENLPPTSEGGGGIRIHERAHTETPLFPADVFAHIVAQSVSAEAETGMVTLRAGDGFTARMAASGETDFARQPFVFTLQGTAQLVWKVDAQELALALAGRDEAAFQTIVEGFPSIEEARARIEPFWKNSFPTDPSAIKVKIGEPKPAS